ncbi:MAG: FAD:protein FMN transferase, partial [Candidatus Omnitrophica bacterium]|nr:FAD:protein FMN transferase [Candidatus Omnitrophota bacterium]
MNRFITGLLCLCVFICGCQKSRVIYRDRQAMMGTLVQVTSTDERAAKIVFDEMKRIDAMLGKNYPGSEINKLNSLGKLKVSPDLFFVIRKAREFWVLSNGEFDITAGRLMQIWGYADKKFRKPSEEELSAALALTGMDKVTIDAARRE